MTDTDTKRVVGDGSELGIVFWDRRNWTRYVNVNAVAIPFHNPPPHRPVNAIIFVVDNLFLWWDNDRAEEK